LVINRCRLHLIQGSLSFPTNPTVLVGHLFYSLGAFLNNKLRLLWCVSYHCFDVHLLCCDCVL